MVTSLATLLLLSQQAPPPLGVATFHGGIAVVQGVLANNPTVNNSPQSVMITVNSVTTTYNNVYLIQDPGNPVIAQGLAVTLVLQGSTPLIANFTKGAVIVDETRSNNSNLSAKSIPMSTNGQLQASFLIPRENARDGIQFTWPPFSITPFNFANGMTGKWNAYPTSYNMAMPTLNASVASTVTFPASTAAPATFDFEADGLSSQLLFYGDGNANPLNVIGSLTGVSTQMVKGHFNVLQGTP